MIEPTEQQKEAGFKVKELVYLGYAMNGGTALSHQYRHKNGNTFYTSKKLADERPGTRIELLMNDKGQYYRQSFAFIGSVDEEEAARLQMQSAAVYDGSIAETERKSNKAPDYLKPIIKNLAFAYRQASNKPQFLARLIYLITRNAS
jgi:hypothetical protein